jgi:hypothetical protein
MKIPYTLLEVQGTPRPKLLVASEQDWSEMLLSAEHNIAHCGRVSN